jgi:hypothetical protein
VEARTGDAHHGRSRPERACSRREVNKPYRVCVGILYYGGAATPIPIDDRALAHLKVVIATKLRRSESFTLSWVHPEDQPRGRSAIWLQPSIPLRFVFDDPEPPTLNPQWVQELASSANSSGGITLTAEQVDTDTELTPEEQSSTPVSVGKVEVEELAIDSLTVAGTPIIAKGTDPAAEPSDSTGVRRG